MYFVLLDNVFLENDFIDLYVDKENGLSSRRIFPVERKCLDFLKNPGSINTINFKYVLELVNHLLHINDYNNLALLLDLAYNKKYLNFCDLFYSPLYNKNFNPNLIYNDNSISINFLNNMVFIVDDKELFINSIREKGYNVNEGPQQWRGHINSMSNFLSHLDSDYRNYLYNHYNYHLCNKTLPYYARYYSLKKENFYFINIHHNLGNIKW
jgi:hypothetical protein